MKQIEKRMNDIVELLVGCSNYCSACDYRETCKKFHNMTKDELIEYLNSEVSENFLSDDEYIILKNIDKKWKLIGRDGGKLFTFNQDSNISVSDYVSLEIYNHLFKFIKCENDEPFEIEKLLEGYEVNKHGN